MERQNCKRKRIPLSGMRRQMDYLVSDSCCPCGKEEEQQQHCSTCLLHVSSHGNALGSVLQSTARKTSTYYEEITSLISNINTTSDTLICKPALMSQVNTLKLCLISISNQYHFTKKRIYNKKDIWLRSVCGGGCTN